MPNITLYLRDDARKRLQKLANKRGVSMSTLVDFLSALQIPCVECEAGDHACRWCGGSGRVDLAEMMIAE